MTWRLVISLAWPMRWWLRAAAQTGVVGQAYVPAQLEWLLGLVSQQQQRLVKSILLDRCNGDVGGW